MSVSASDDDLRRRHQVDLATILPGQVERLDWPAEQLCEERQHRLRRFLAVAKSKSRWHAERLRDVDVEHVTEQDLSGLPVMTKDDLMAHFDDIVTDRRVMLARAEAHLASLGAGDAYLDGEYHVVASGGSSGRRGVFVWGWEPWTLGGAARVRQVIRDQLRCGEQPGAAVSATVAAEVSTHMTGAFASTFPTSFAHRFPVTLPIEEIVGGLNRVQPALLHAYSSALALLVREVDAGRLRIRPNRVIATAEPLLPETRAAITAAWGARVANSWGTSEGASTAMGCFAADGMHLSYDNLIIEPVDEEGSPVPPGKRATKLYLTNLINPVLPLIRYEVTDEITVLPEPCPCGSGMPRVADIQGRHDDTFDYEGVHVHPHVFRSVLGREPSVVEYQVHQTPSGATILIRCTFAPDLDRLRTRIVDGLQRAGVGGSTIDLQIVEYVPRQSSGKLKRFVPLGVSTKSPTA
jgi:phenylacetate-CoA ligase